MKDITEKTRTLRTASARAILKVNTLTIDVIKNNKVPKGNPLEVAKIAAIQAAKETSRAIPYCHPVPIEAANVEFKLGSNTIEVTTQTKSTYKTGVEMEALHAAAIAALTLYDMLKYTDEDMEITGISLVEKTGGRSQFKKKIPNKKLKTAVLVLSDSISRGENSDVSGKTIVELLKEYEIDADYKILSDDAKEIKNCLLQYTDKENFDLVITTGGTGLSNRDCVPEVMTEIIEKTIPGIAETMRAFGQEQTPYAMLSRSQAGVRGKTLIVNLPGSRGGVRDSLAAVFPHILHTFEVMESSGHHLAHK